MIDITLYAWLDKDYCSPGMQEADKVSVEDATSV